MRDDEARGGPGGLAPVESVDSTAVLHDTREKLDLSLLVGVYAVRQPGSGALVLNVQFCHRPGSTQIEAFDSLEALGRGLMAHYSRMKTAAQGESRIIVPREN